MKLCVMTLLLMSGCAAKKPVKPAATLTNCVEVSIDARTNKVTVVCPLPGAKR